MKWQNWLQNLAQRTRTASRRRRKGRAQHTAGWYRRAALNTPTEFLEQRALLAATATVTITATAAPSESDASTSYTITISGSGTTDADIDFNITEGAGGTTATGGGVDFTESGNIGITVSAGYDFTGSGDVTIPVSMNLTNDNRLEADEAIVVLLDNLSFGGGDSVSFINDTFTATITDNETATVSLDSTGTDSLTEDAGGTPSANVSATLTITTDGAGTGTVGSDVTVTAGLAGNADFMTTADASFGPGDYTSDTQNITISAVNDNRLEATTESFAGQTVGVTADGGANVSADAGNSRTVEVADNESATVSIGTATATVGEDGTSDNVAVTLDLTTDGTGTAGIDVTVSVGLTTNSEFSDTDATFTPGDGDPQMQNIVLDAVDDRLLEATTESYAGQTLDAGSLVTGGADVSIAGGSGTYQVDVVDDEDGELTVAYMNVNEGGGVQTVATVTLTINATGSGNVELDTGISISADITDAGGGTAVDATDYATPGTQTVTFDSNAATGAMRTASLNPVADRLVEGDETVNLVLGNLSDGGTSSALSGTLTGSPEILDDDTASVSFDMATSNVDEQDVSHVVGVTLTISASGSVGGDGLERSVSVDVTNSGGTATNGTMANDDFTYASPTTLTFNPFSGTTASDSVTLNIREDIVDDDAETIVLTTAVNTDNTGGQVTSADMHTVTINDDDTATDAIFEFPDDGSADSYRVVLNGGNLEIRTVPGNVLVTSRAFASITNVIITGADGEDDTLQVDLSGGDVIPAGGINFSGGTGGNDSLEILGGAQGTTTYNYTNANDGNVVMSAFGTITYTGLEPITNTGTATNVVFNLPTGVANADATLQNNGGAADGFNELTGSTFESTVFTTPSSSLTINLGDSGDTLAVNTLDTASYASLIINGDSTVSDQVTMNGVTIDNAGGGRGLFVTEVETLNITGGTISNNTATYGGGVAIINSSSGTSTTAMLTNVTISSNTASDGAGLVIVGDAAVTLDGVTLQNNTASNRGGGLYNDGADVTIQNSSLIDGNDAQGTFGAGGGIFNDGDGTLSITSSSITGNTASDAQGYGGGIEHESSGTVMLTNVTLDGNDAYVGGGMNQNGSGAVTITGGTVSTNTAAYGAGLNNYGGSLTVSGVTIAGNNASGLGGGIAVDGAAATVLVESSTTITGNTAGTHGGGIYNYDGTVTVDSSTISGNTATTGNGGGISNYSGSVTVDNATISGNMADGDGGGINDDGGTVIVQNNSMITGNTATNGDGGGIDSEGPLTINGSTISGNDAGTDGGGVWSDSGLTLLNTVVISGNDAGVSGGGLYLDGTITTTGATITISNNTASGNAATQGGGGIFNNGNTIALDGDDTLSGNSADGTSGSGGGIFNAGGTLNFNGTTIDSNEASRAGGGIETDAGSMVNLTNVSLTNNTAGTGVSSVANPGNGGGLHVTGAGTVLIDGGTITGNDADNEGGGLWNGSGTMTISDASGNVLIDSNTASGTGGGGIFNSAGGTVLIQDNGANTVTISNNDADGASGSGGGIFNNTGSTLTVTGAIIDSNSANRAGGGIEDNSGAGGGVTLTNVSLTNNDVDGGAGAPNPGNGGGLHVTGAGNVLIDGGTITGNDARAEGGGLWNGTGTLTISDASGNVLIDGNTASGNAANEGGGGIFNAGGSVLILDTGANTVTISNNLADGTMGSGGGILNDAGGTLTITGAVIDSNSANRAGGGIEDNSGAGLGVSLTNVTLSNNDVDGGAGSPNPGNGGGLHVTGAGDVNIDGGTITGNDAASEGGGLWNGTGTLTISDTSGNVLIDGNTASGAAADNGGGGIFNAGGTVIIQDNGANTVTISNNDADGTLSSGGGILNDGGALTVTGAVIDNNNAEHLGGGIAQINSGATLTLTNVTIQNNDALGAGAGDGSGGGVYADNSGEDVNITNSTISSNTASGLGGGIDFVSTGTLTLTNTLVEMNSAVRGGGLFLTNGTANVDVDSTFDQNSASLRGGGIENFGATLNVDGTISANMATGGDGGGILAQGGTTTLDGATVTGNSASASGGGVAVEASGNLMIINSSLISSNTAAINGGGVHGRTGSTVSITDSTVSGNTATSNGGGIGNDGAAFTVTNSLIDMNTATNGDGGGIWNNAGDLTLQSNTVVSGNIAGDNGGGLYLGNATGTLSITDTDFDMNTANGTLGTEGGGGIYNDGLTFTLDNTVQITDNTASAGNGGGLFNSNSGNVTLSGTIVTGNDATAGNGGGVYNQAGSSLTVGNSADVSMNSAGTDGGGIWNGGTLAVNGVMGTVTLDQNTAGRSGGGLFLASGSTTTINDAMITDNTASGNAATNGGGGIYNDGNTLSLDGTVTIDGNNADGTSGSGGGIFNNTGGVLTLNGTTITSNTANRAGGGIEDNSGAGLGLTLTGVTLDSNSAGVDIGDGATANPGNGGGLHVSNGGDVNITGGTVNSNVAASEGGGLWNSTGTMTIIDVQIDGNTASGGDMTNGGGGIFNAGGTVTTNEGTTITNNVADGAAGSGGGVFNDGGTFIATGTVIAGNTANRAGGGVETNAGTVTLNDILLTGNSAGVDIGAGATPNPGNGGGLHITGAGTVNINNIGTFRASQISGNVAASEGGGLWNSATGTLNIDAGNVDDVLIVGNTAQGAAADNGGGGLFNDGGTVTITGTDNDNAVIFGGNSANGTNGSGGAILNVAGTIDNGAGGPIGNILIDSNFASRAGGGIEMIGGSITLTNSRITANSTGASPGNGGGVHITNDGSVTLDATTVDNNTAVNEGGGLWNSANGTITLTNVTISSNSTTTGDGGGIFSVGGGTGVVDADSVTITLNDAGSGTGSGIAVSAVGGVLLENTIVAQNPGGGTEENLSGPMDSILSQDFNLIGDPDNGILANPINETIFDGDAILGPLQDNGNPNEVDSVPIPTHLPSAGSPAIGTGDTDLPDDQNDTPRPQASRDDIGAVEVQLNGFVIDAGAQANDGNPDEFVIIQDNMGTADPSDDEVVVFVNSVEVFRDSAVTTGQIIIRGSSDDDTLIMDNSEGLVQSHIIFDGDGTGSPSPSSVFNPGGFDTLVLRGSTPTTTTYNPGESADSGAIFQENNAITQRVEFFGLEPVQVVGTGAGDTLVLGSIVLGAGFPQALNDANMITYREGDNSQSEFHPVFGSAATGVAGGAVTGLIEVDGFEGLEFSNFGTLNINAGSGSDEIVLNHRDIASDLTTINVDGGDPTAGSDTVIVTANGTTDAIAVTNVTADGATVDVTLDTTGTPVMQPTVVVTGTEHLVLDGAGGNDVLSVTGTANDEQFGIIPSTADTGGDNAIDAGSLLLVDVTTTTTLLSINFEDLGLAGAVILDGGDGNDLLLFAGSQLDDTIAVGADNSVIAQTVFIGVASANIENLLVAAGDGSDTITIDGTSTYASVSVQGGVEGDSVTVTAGAGDNVVVDLVAGTVTGTSIALIDLSEVETLTINGGDGTNTVTVNGLGSTTGLSALNIDGTNLASLTVDGTADDDVLVFNPTSATGGTIANSAGSSSLAVSYSGLAATLNATGGSGGFDILEVLGTADDDTITTTATTITRDGTVTFDGSIEQTNILAGAGNDSITTGALATLKVLDGGAGDDSIDASAAVDATILGGDGDDTLIGSPVADFIDGGRGSDDIDAGAGDDTVYGGEGDDSIIGDAGDDEMYGGDGDDMFVWNPGDGDDIVEGEAGSDLMVFNGSGADESFTFSDEGGFLDFTRDLGGSITGTTLEIFALNAEGGADTVNVGEQLTTGLTGIIIDLGAADGVADGVVVEGTTSADHVNVSEDGSDVFVGGLSTAVLILNADSTTDGDTLTVNGNEGDDVLKAEPGVEDTILISLSGGAGNDELSADATLDGGDGNDTLTGGAGNDSLNGGAGDDLINLSDGDDTIVGGDGFDIVAYTGTEADDTLSLVEAANVLTVTGLLTGTADVTAADIERIDVTGGSGDDDITLDAVTTQALVDAGAGDDSVDASTMTAASVTVSGGAGKDSISGGDQDDELSGGAGDDLIAGGMGDDVISGGEGFDQLSGNEGDDAIDGGDGVDIINWVVGDGFDTVSGGSDGSDIMNFSADGMANNIFVSGGDQVVNVSVDGEASAVLGVEFINIDSGIGGDTIVVGDLHNSEIQQLTIDLNGDGDAVTVEGRDANDVLTVSTEGAGEVNIAGFTYGVKLDSTATADTLTINGNDGDDVITAIDGVESEITLVFNGGQGNDALTGDGTLNGDEGNDVLTGLDGNNVLNGGDGDDTLNLSDGDDTLSGGNGFDIVNYAGTEDDDTLGLAEAAGVITVTGVVTGTADVTADDIERVDVTGGNGDDTVTLTGLTTASTIDAGAGDDDITLSGLTENATVHAGDGDDTVDGSGVANDAVQLSLYGENGNDNLIGGDSPTGSSPGDILDGGAGNDRLEGGRGQDVMFGGADNDLFVWVAGDGTDLIEGGTGNSDELQFDAGAGDNRLEVFGGGRFGDTGNPAPNVFGDDVLGDSSRVVIALNSTAQDSAAVFLNMGDVESIDMNADAGADQIVINNQVDATSTLGSAIQRGTELSNTSLRAIDADLGAADGAADSLDVHGSLAADAIDVTVQDGNINVEGLGFGIRFANSDVTDVDQINVYGQAGNDVIKAEDGVEGTVAVQLIGNGGNDYLSADATLLGGAGDDTLEGGAGDDVLRGNGGRDLLIGNGGNDLLDGDAGHDTFIGGDGDDTIEGGDGFDTILIEGSDDGNVIYFSQTTDNSVTYDVDGDTQTDTIATAGAVERAQILAHDGADLIGVTWTDGVAESLRVDVNGGADSTLDRIAVNDDGVGDLVLYRRGADDQSGSITVGPGNAEPFVATFQDIEFVQPIAAADGEVRVFDVDGNEFNDTRTLATHLGANDTLSVDATIEPSATALLPFALPADRDFFEIVADETGTLDITVFFDELSTVASGRPGLPGNGNLDIQVRDINGDVIAGTGAFGENDSASELNVDGDTDAENERVRIPVVAGQTYYLEVFGADNTVLNNYSVTTINDPAPVPYDLELLDNPTGDDTLNNMPSNSDTGRNQTDNITRDNTPTIVFRLDDGIFLHDLPGNDANDTPPDQVIPIPFQAGAGAAGYRIAIFDEGNSPAPGTQTGTQPQTPLGYATAVAGQEGVYQFTTPVLTDGSHFLTARVQMVDPSTELQTGFGARSVSLEIVVDTVDPPVEFGLAGVAGDGLDASSDSGVVGQSGTPDTFTDRVTNDTTPTFYGTAEADTIVRVYVDTDDDGMLDPTIDRLIAQTVATPVDGSDQFPSGRWEVTSNVNLNDDSLGLGQDGTRRIFATAEDVSGNLADPDELLIFLDTRGPQVYDPAGPEQAVYIDGSPDFNLFGIKETGTNLAPTPLIDAIRVNIQDLPNRDDIDVNFQYLALLTEQAEAIGNVEVRGDLSGVVAIQSIVFEPDADPATDGQAATGELIITFFEPLPDDRFTLTINDTLVDPAGNSLDGESNSSEPNGGPTFPTGDGQPGGSFSARFTVDSRPEIGAIGQNLVTLDLNGNGVFDTMNGVTQGDTVNGDLVFDFGIETDSVFAGQFTPAGTTPGDEDGFDRLGAFGRVGGVLRFVLDFDNDGVVDFTSTLAMADPPAGAPIAGNFDESTGGDEIGLFDANNGVWYLDTNGDNILGNAGDTTITGNLRGAPIVGDFDGDGMDDLATYRADMDTFYFDLTGAADGTPGMLDANADATISFGRPGVQERPFAADLDQDGIDDIGLKAPNLEANTPTDTADWFILLSDDRDMTDRVPGTVNTLNHPFSPAPLGQDAFVHFATNNSEPIVGNFDPPVGTDSGSSSNVTLDFTGGVLTVTATAGASIEIGAVSGQVVVTVDGQVDSSLGSLSASAVTSIAVIGSADADSIDLSGVDGADFTNLTSVSVNAGGGDDLVTGSSLDDMLAGEGGDDTMSGGDGDDFLRGGAGRDVMDGGAGNDRLLGQGSSGDRLRGGLGDDTLDGGMGTDTVEEAADQDFTLTDGTLTGGTTGNDTLIDIEQAELSGGDSGNVIDASGFSGSVTVFGGNGADQITGGSTVDLIYGADGDDTINGGGGNDIVHGMGGDDIIDGGDGNDMLRGGSGRDTINGGAGDDQLYGQGGTGDVLSGGAGNDLIDGGDGVDRVAESADTDFTLTDSSLVSAATGNDILVSIEGGELNGGAGNNQLDATGFSGFTTLRGGAGDDTILAGPGGTFAQGGDGNDSITGNSGFDLVNGQGGADTIDVSEADPGVIDKVTNDLLDSIFLDGIDDILI